MDTGYFDLGDFLLVNSKKRGGDEEAADGKRPSERKLITVAPLVLAGGKPQRNTTNSFVLS